MLVECAWAFGNLPERGLSGVKTRMVDNAWRIVSEAASRRAPDRPVGYPELDERRRVWPSFVRQDVS